MAAPLTATRLRTTVLKVENNFVMNSEKNSKVVLVVSFNKQMRNTTNLLILNLAVADILFIVFCVPFSAAAYALPHNWLFGDAW
jgi:hypothetical protein